MVKGCGGSEDAGVKENLAPWEQHSAVISIPRFDYRAPSSLLEHSHSGFLITCAIKREKSATKEALSLLDKPSMKMASGCKRTPLPLNGNTSKRRKICLEGKGGEDVNSLDHGNPITKTEASGECQGGSSSSTSETTESASSGTGASLSLVKLIGSGLILFMFPRNSSPPTTHILSDIFSSMGSGSLKLQWCHRILPFQATCIMEEAKLRTAVSKLFKQFLEDEWRTHEKPMKFAVGYNKRGVDETQMIDQKAAGKESNQVRLLERNECFGVVAGAVKNVSPDAVVDLKSPQVVVFVELLPISGLPQGSVVAAVSVLPQDLVAVKPRLTVKALISDSKHVKRI